MEELNVEELNALLKKVEVKSGTKPIIYVSTETVNKFNIIRDMQDFDTQDSNEQKGISGFYQGYKLIVNDLLDKDYIWIISQKYDKPLKVIFN